MVSRRTLKRIWLEENLKAMPLTNKVSFYYILNAKRIIENPKENCSGAERSCSSQETQLDSWKKTLHLLQGSVVASGVTLCNRPKPLSQNSEHLPFDLQKFTKPFMHWNYLEKS